MKTRIFRVAGLLALFLFSFAVMATAQTQPPIGPDSGGAELAEYWNFLWMGLQAVGTLVVGYLAYLIPGIKNLKEKFYQVAALALVLGLFLYLAFSGGKTVWELINPIIGFVTATGLIYPGVLKPAGLASAK
jgi:hypothetical protein